MMHHLRIHSHYNLHLMVFWTCLALGIIVFGVLIYTLIYQHKSRRVKTKKSQKHPALEIIWAIIPFIILLAMAIPAARVFIQTTAQTTSTQ